MFGSVQPSPAALIRAAFRSVRVRKRKTTESRSKQSPFNQWFLWLRRQDSNLRPVAVPGRRCVRRSGLAPCRPLPLARVAPPAPGGAPLAPLREPRGRPKSFFITKKEHHPAGWGSFLVAEAGLEPTTSGL